MKIIWLSCLLLICAFNSFAQSSKLTDSLILLAEQSQDEKQKLKIYGDLSWQFSTRNYDKAVHYGNLALSLAEKLKDSSAIALAYSDLGNANLRVNNLKEALDFHLRALSLRESLGLKAQAAGSISNISIIYKQMGNFKDALVYMHKSLKIYENAKDENKQAIVLANIGNVYMAYQKYEEAKESYEKAIGIATKSNQKEVLALAYSGMFNYYFRKSEFKRSLEYVFKAQEYLAALNQKSELASINNNLGRVFHIMKDYDKALNYYNQSLKTRLEMQDQIGIGSCYKNMAETYLELKDNVKARFYLEKSIAIFRTEGAKEYLREALFTLAKVNEVEKDYQTALDLYKVSNELKDSIYSKEARAKINELEIAYQTEKKAQQIVQLNQENSIHKLQVQNRNILLIVAAGLFLVAMVVSYLLFKSYRLKQEAKSQEALFLQQEQATVSVLKAEENERKRIARDLHDGIGQLFSAVKMNLSAIEQGVSFKSAHDKESYQKTLSLVDESCQELRSLSHQMSSNSLVQFGLIHALKEFIQKVDSRKLRINLESVGFEERLDSNIEIVLYRIIQEAINNVIKHANANTLDIQIVKEKDSLDLMIEDNGVGFDFSEGAFLEGLGLKNLKSRVAYLKGTLDFSSKPNVGTLIAIHIPL